MKSCVVIVRVLFCGNVIGARAFPGMDGARGWARKMEGMGNVERDGPRCEVEYSM